MKMPKKYAEINKFEVILLGLLIALVIAVHIYDNPWKLK